MPKRKHIPPSRKRYVEANPTVSIRVSKGLKELLDEVRNETSYGQFIKELIQQQKGRIKRAYDAGYEKARKDWQIVIPCDECGREFPVPADPNDGVYDVVRDHIIKGGVLCEKCANE